MTKSLSALKAVVTRRSKPFDAAVPAASRTSLPLDDDFPAM